jgi:hypothetical protein
MWIRLFIGVMIIVAIVLGALFYSGYAEQSTTAASLAQTIQTDSLNLSTITKKNTDIATEIAGLSTNISKAEAILNSSQVTLPDMVDSNVIVRKIISYGDQTGVTVIPLGTKDWASLNIDKHDYHVFKMSIEVKGPQQNVIDYIKQVQDSVDQYLVIEHLNIAKVSNNPTSWNDTSANLDIAIYAK